MQQVDADYSNYQQKSKYNEAGNQIDRLDKIWRACHFYRANRKLWEWNLQLDSAWPELAGDKKLFNTKHEVEYISFNSLIVKNQGNKERLYQILLKKEIFLRKLQSEQGKGGSYDNTSKGDYE